MVRSSANVIPFRQEQAPEPDKPTPRRPSKVPRYRGRKWIGNAITKQPEPIGPNWIGKRISG